MRIFKLIFISIIVFAVIITLFSLLLPSNVTVSKAIDITATRQALYQKLSEPAEWKKWYPGADTMTLIVNGLETNDSKAILSILEKKDDHISIITKGERIKKMQSGWNIMPSGRPNEYTVQWYMKFRLKWYPWEKFSAILLEKRYGPMMEQGLDKLKTLLEK